MERVYTLGVLHLDPHPQDVNDLSRAGRESERGEREESERGKGSKGALLVVSDQVKEILSFKGKNYMATMTYILLFTLKTDQYHMLPEPNHHLYSPCLPSVRQPCRSYTKLLSGICTVLPEWRGEGGLLEFLAVRTGV